MTLLQDVSDLRMENMSKVGSSFVFLRLLELERYWLLFSIVVVGVYVIPTLLCCLIVYVIWVEESLHEPMYAFICNLLLNGVFGNTVIFPQIIVHLLLGSSTISFSGCVTQAYCVESYAAVEILTFTTMAYDRYLAVGNPLRYSSIMTNIKALKYISGIWALILTLVLMAVIMAARLTICGVNINNIYCEVISIVRLACEDTSLNNIFGLVEKVVVLAICVMIIVFCYIATLLICLKTSGSASHKAIHTLVSHIITFSFFLATSCFVFLRYRLNIGNISVTAHILLSITGVLTSVTVNPIVYGLRTESLKLRLNNNLQKMNVCKNFSPSK